MEEMKTKSETKIHSIRADEETIAHFKKICEDFPNNSEALKALINAHEMAQAKKITGQETNISDFQSHIDSLMRAYINSLDLITNTENRVRDEFRELLDSKDKTIINLQQQLANSKEAAEQSEMTVLEYKQKFEELERTMEAQIAKLNTRLSSVKKEQESAEQTMALVNTTKEALEENIRNLKEQLANTEEIKEQNKELQAKLSAVTERAEKAERELEQSKLEIEHIKLAKDKEIFAEKTKAVDEMKNLYAKISELQSGTQKSRNTTKVNNKKRAD